jgi:hypothetical protein
VARALIAGGDEDVQRLAGELASGCDGEIAVAVGLRRVGDGEGRGADPALYLGDDAFLPVEPLKLPEPQRPQNRGPGDPEEEGKDHASYHGCLMAQGARVAPRPLCRGRRPRDQPMPQM